MRGLGVRQPKVALITVSLAGERVDLAWRFAHDARASLATRGMEVLSDEAGSCGEGAALPGADEAGAALTADLSGVGDRGAVKLTGPEVIRAARTARDRGADCIVYLIGTWVSAPDVVSAVREVGLPTVIWGLPEPESFSSVGANVVHGSLDDMGLAHELVYGMPDDGRAIGRIFSFARAAMVVRTLDGSRFGLIGGRSIGMYPSTVDPVQVKMVFGIEIEHVDQLQLIEAARALEDGEAFQALQQLRSEYGAINVPDEVMVKSLKVHLALRELVDQRGFDFIGVKCLEEVINAYVSCCLAVSFANDAGIVTACQSDVNTAIAMRMLATLSGGPVIFSDVNSVNVESRIALLINCGSLPTTLARCKKDVDWGLQYEYMGKARGACPTFCCKSGQVTIASLARVRGSYVLQIANGEAFEQPRSTFAEVRDVWPRAFVRLACDPEQFYQGLRSNHVAACYGDVAAELVDVARMLGIEANLVK